MRTFGTNQDNLIDEMIAYGTNNYEIAWYQNGLKLDIEAKKATIHYVGAKYPLGNVTKDYLELNTEYLDFLEEDAIRIDITADGSTLTVGTYYVAPGFRKTKYDASYTAYSSLIDLGLKLDAWSDAPEHATIGIIVHHFMDPLGIEFDVEPSSTITFNPAMTDFSSVTLGELLGYCACIEQCNYVLRGNVLCKVVPSIDVTKEYNIDEVVYSENLSQIASDASLDYIKVNYKTVTQSEDEEGQLSYDFNDASYVCKDGTENCGFELNIGLVPSSESALQSHFSTYFTSVKGMDCNGYNISFLGDARVEVGDKLKFSNDSTSAILNVSELTWEWDGGLKCTVSSGSDISINSGSGFSIHQVVSQIQAMTNAMKNVQYNAVYTNELYAKVAELGYASIDELKAEVAKMGYITADEADIKYLTASSANLKFANIELSNIAAGTIQTAMIATGAIGTAQIADGSITDAKIVGLTANKITAGTLDAATIEVVNLNAANITVGTINGHQIASGAISLDNLGSDVTDKIAATESDVAAAVADAKSAILNSSQAVLNASNAVSTVTDLENRANSGEFKGEKGDKGDKGDQGIQGIQGIKGDTGATGPKGDTGDTGAQGPKGDTGSAGRGIKSTAITYQASSSGTTVPTGTWSTSIPSVAENQYLWTKTYITYTDNTTSTSYSVGKMGAKGDTGATGATGATGKGVSSIVEQYYLSTSSTAQSGGSWSNTCPAWESGKYIWVRQYITWSDSTNSITTPTLANAINGANSTAATANTNASKAVSTANSASSTASTANTNASNAVNTANTAKSTAESAKTTADANAEVILNWCKDNNTLYIDGAKLYAGTVVADAIASGAIVADKIASSAVTAVKIASGAITTDKLAANAVTAAKIAAGTITATQIAASTITGSKIATGTISATNIASNAITSDKIVSSAVTADKIASSAITADKIVTGAITTDKLDANAVTASKIATGAITTDKLDANSVTASKISVSSLSAITANLGTITAGIIQSSNFTMTDITVDSSGNPTYTVKEGIRFDLTNKVIETPQFQLKKDYLNLIGNMTIGTRKSDTVCGMFSFVQGSDCEASEYGSHAEGSYTIASGKMSHAEGWMTTASNHMAHAEGDNTIASGFDSHAEGYLSIASGTFSHAEGHHTTAEGQASHTEGVCTKAIGLNSHAGGDSTIAAGKNQTAIGKYNVSDTTSAFIIGNGTSDDVRSNAMKVDFDGNMTLDGTINGYTLAAACARGVLTRNSVGDCGYSTASNRTNLADGNMLAYWNGAYSGTASNLAYCNRGAFGTIVTKGTGDYLPINPSNIEIIPGSASAGHGGYIDFHFNQSTSDYTSRIIEGSSGVIDIKGALRVSSTVSAGTTAKTNCYIDTAGRLYKTSTTSSRRFKKDIKLVENDELNPEALYDVDVVQFKYKENHFSNEEDIRYGKDMIGFIAEDIYDKYKIAADYHVDEDSGEVLVDGWNEQYLIPAMLKLIQELNARVIYLENNMKG